MRFDAEYNFRYLDSAIHSLQQAIENSVAVERLHRQEVDEIDNALQYGLVFSLVLNRHRSERLTSPGLYDEFEDMIPRIEKVTEVVMQAVEKLRG